MFECLNRKIACLNRRIACLNRRNACLNRRIECLNIWIEWWHVWIEGLHVWILTRNTLHTKWDFKRGWATKAIFHISFDCSSNLMLHWSIFHWRILIANFCRSSPAARACGVDIQTWRTKLGDKNYSNLEQDSLNRILDQEKRYSVLSLRRTPSGPAFGVRLMLRSHSR